MTQLHPFVCPHCLGHLTETPTALSCQSCGQAFPLPHGVPDFSAKSDYYYGEFSQSEMRSLVDTAVREGSARAFENALQGRTEEWRQYFRHYATDETRAAWQFLLRLPENATVLDLGCGWGNISLSLARNFAAVYGLDLVPERAVMTSVRAREAGLANVTALAGGNAPHLPFPDASMDAVVLNGVLEWVPVSFSDIADPREAQLCLLREIARTLKPDGEVYVGIENRIGYGYFLGKPDEHSKLKYATLLPRSWANRYSLAKRREPYRTYTYSWRGYRKLLRDAGLMTARFYCPFPEYREFSELIDLNRPQNLARALYPTSFLGRLGMQVCKRVSLFREFSPSYSIVASKTSGDDRFIDRLLHHIGVTSSEAVRIHVTRTAAALLFTAKVLVRLPLTPRAELRMREEIANLKQIYSPQRPLIPKLIAEGELQGQPYFASSAFPGISGSKLLGDQQKLTVALRHAIHFITRFHRETREEQVCTEEWLKQNFDWLVDYVCALGVDVSELKTLCRRDLLGKRIVRVTSHGDFGLQNLVFDPRTTNLTGVVDWDLADFGGWPARDPIHLFTALQYETDRSTFSEAVLAVLKRLRDERGLERELLGAYLAAIQAEPEQIVWAIQRYILRNIHDKNEYGDRKIGLIMMSLKTEMAAARQLTGQWLSVKGSMPWHT